MSGPRKFALVTALIGAVVLPASAQSIPDRSDLGKGRDLALKLCSICHVVWAEQPTPPKLRDPTKSFPTIANEPDTTSASLRAFIASTHRTVSNPSNMPNPSLTNEEMTEIVGYILSLRKSP